ncbi:uncharacterized protein LOC123507441 isoform X3 [Portunus trituberculatus]|uniref:uncharacterized protein LOC123507441 isoform X3 n=1 Tax=Portunus trituberculatus TaxID=210409 RepID=UPI001E1CC10D|nr:uncharacterized protein LOC123507441 isoform X3 [Portunus trituberculatus]
MFPVWHHNSNTMKHLVVFLVFVHCVAGVCYFPVEYQGIFATQSSVSSLSQGTMHQYSQVTILPDAIPVWGVCHTKFENNVILRDSTGGENCYRCFHVSLHSGNVIQIYTEGLNKCYSSEAAALLTCPTLHAIKTRRVSEIMLYKSRSFTQDGLIDRVFCPINGRFHFTYDVNDGTESSVECPEPSSELSNCPRGSELQLRFRRCSFGELNMSLRCLGDWRGHDGQRYLALWDPAVTTHNQPRYRCAMYSVDQATQKVYLSFSIDATCTNHLHGPWDGYETMELFPLAPPSPPSVVLTTACDFPRWTEGAWQHLLIDARELWVQDDEMDKKYKTLCLSQHAPHGERFALYSTNQCGEDEFTCIWIKKRAVNVIEYQMGVSPSKVYNASRICSDDAFRGQTWKTQGRLSPENLSGCPITGEYTGVIPDATELCARLSSDCNDPQHMHYTVSSCRNATEVYEERDYRCLGQWSEGGVMYTFTHRRDVDTYECFAGVVVNPNEIFIIEAGTSCQRGLQPLAHGMKLVRQATCSELQARMTSTAAPHDPSSRPSWWPPTTKNPWMKKNKQTPLPDWNNEIPRAAHSSGSDAPHSLMTSLLAAPLLLLLLAAS